MDEGPVRCQRVVGRHDELERIWRTVEEYESYRKYRDQKIKEGCYGKTTMVLGWIEDLVDRADELDVRWPEEALDLLERVYLDYERLDKYGDVIAVRPWPLCKDVEEALRKNGRIKAR